MSEYHTDIWQSLRVALFLTILLPLGSIASIGPLIVANEDSTAELRLQFAGQLRAQYQNLDDPSGVEDEVTMEARRVRLTLGGGFPAHDLDMKLHLSFGPGSIELMDFFANYRLTSEVQLRAGQFKIPFTRYRIQSFQRLTFVDWSVTTRYFGAERQMGFAAHNGYETPPTFGYAFGLFTGVNARGSHATGLPFIYGESIPNPSDLADPADRADFHPELAFHLSYNPGSIAISSDTDTEGTGYRHSVALSAAIDLDPDVLHDLKARAAAEYLIKYQGFSVSAVGYIGWIETLGAGATTTGFIGGLVQSAYRITDKLELSLRYALIDTDRELVDAASARADDLLASRDNLTSDDVKRLAEAGRVTREQELTVGCNIYIDGHSLKWQNDLSLLHRERTDNDRTDYRIRSQFQIAF